MYFSDADVAEVLVWQRALPGAERAAVEAALAAKFALSYAPAAAARVDGP
jgi:hypothetical protein